MATRMSDTNVDGMVECEIVTLRRLGVRGKGKVSVSTASNGLSFDQWMKTVDEIIWSKLGCSVYDLPDCCFRDWYDSGKHPASAATCALRAARDED